MRAAAVAKLGVVLAGCVPAPLTLASSAQEAGGGSTDSAAMDSKSLDAPSDGGVDARSTWCTSEASTAFLCIDFDEGDAEGGLTLAYHAGMLTTIPGPSVSPGTAVALTPDASSPPFAFLGTTPVTSMASVAARYDQLPALPATNAAEVDFAMNPE